SAEQGSGNRALVHISSGGDDRADGHGSRLHGHSSTASRPEYVDLKTSARARERTRAGLGQPGHRFQVEPARLMSIRPLATIGAAVILSLVAAPVTSAQEFGRAPLRAPTAFPTNSLPTEAGSFMS